MTPGYHHESSLSNMATYQKTFPCFWMWMPLSQVISAQQLEAPCKWRPVHVNTSIRVYNFLACRLALQIASSLVWLSNREVV